jgi:hypothetical protein
MNTNKLKRMIRLLRAKELGAVLALAALGLSLYNFFAAQRPADVVMTVSTAIRVQQEAGLVAIYLQPQFVSKGATDRVEVIDQVAAELVVGGDPAVHSLAIDSVGSWDITGAPSYTENWKITTRVEQPFVVTPTSPQLPTFAFFTRDLPSWTSGTYHIAIRAHRLVARDWLTSRLGFTLTEDQVKQIDAEGSAHWIQFRGELESQP